MNTREYEVGRFKLQPFRQLSDSGRLVPVKPKALAILSVLAEADGALVTKDELMAAVWPNITVEDNAIQAHVASLRKILGQDGELLSTVHGHGYRLARTPASSKAGGRPDPSGAAPRAWRWPTARFVTIFLVVGAAVGSLWLIRNGTQARTEAAQIALLPFDLSSSAMSVFANDLQVKISTDLSSAGILVASRTAGSRFPGLTSKQKDTEFLLGGRITSDGQALSIQIQLSDAAEDAVIWSGTFQKEVSSRAALPPIVATAVADAMHFAVIGRTGKVRLNATSVAALVEARESMTTVRRPNPLLQMADYRKIIAVTPDFTWAHSGLAAADAFQLKSDPQNELLRDEARREANRALALDPANGEAYLALELVLPRFNWKNREAVLLKGIKADPGFAPGAYMEGRLRSAVGRNRDALFWFRRGHNMDPLHNNNSFTYAASLMSEGFSEESRKLLEQMDAQWPEHIATRNAHFWTSVISGSWNDTLAILTDSSKWPVGMNRKSAEVWRMAITMANANKKTAQLRATTTIRDAAAEGSLSRGEAMLLLSLLRDVDGAFEQAQYYVPSDPQWGPILFLAPTQPMRQDRRFMEIAVKLGFAAYWWSTDQWPDFCNAPELPYDCKAEVNRLAGTNPGLTPMTEVRRASIPY
jgi:DNA-binding winged helix-turn-helix (wHTH) protein/TolB-like protein/tetratricopeptide (TPR) repeat protein